MSNLEKLAFVIAATTLCFACKHDTMPTDCNIPANVSFSQDILPLLNQHCSQQDCHSGPSPAGNLNLEAPLAYSQLIQPGKGYIDTITPVFSILYASIDAKVNPMPPTGKLAPCSIALVLEWINQKAPNN